MKKSLFASLCVAALLLAVSCESKSGSNPQITINQEGFLELPFEASPVEVSYTVTDPVDGATVEADFQGVDWISDINTSVDGVVTFNVSENSGDSRSAVMTLSYVYDGGSAQAQINIIQNATDYKYSLDASYATGYYFGDIYNTPGMRYYIWFTENLPNEDGALAQGLNYCLDIFSSAPVNLEAIAPADGIYVISDSYYPGTLNGGNGGSRMAVVNPDNSAEEIYFQECMLNITHEGDQYTIEAYMTDENGDGHRLTYTGPIALTNASYYSTLEEDYEINLDNATASAVYYGDYYGNGTSNYVLSLVTRSEVVTFEILAPATSDAQSIDAGTYNMANTGAPFTFLPGYLSAGSLYQSWYYSIGSDGAATSPYSPLVGGYFEISKDGNGNYTISLHVEDDSTIETHVITGSWTGNIIIEDISNPTGVPAGIRKNAPVGAGFRNVL